MNGWMRADFQSFFAQNRAKFDRKIAQFSMLNMRTRRDTSAPKQKRCPARPATHGCIVCAVFAGAGRASRAKITPNFFGTFAIATENRDFFGQVCGQNIAQRSVNVALLAQRKSNDDLNRLCTLCVHQRLNARRFSKFFRAKSREVRSKKLRNFDAQRAHKT